MADPNVSDPFTASDAIVALYADNYYEYDSERRVTREMTDGGSRTFTFDYFQSSFAEDYNSWKFKTIEGLPDGSQKIVYANYAGQTMLQVHESGADQWCEFWKYNEDAHVILHAHPSAISGYDDQYPDLLHGVDEHYEFLRDDAGLIETYDIHAPTGWVTSEKLQQGQLGTCVRLRDYEYTPFYAGGGGGSSSSSGSSGTPTGQPVYFLTRTTVYPEDGFDCSGEATGSYCGMCLCSNDLTRTIVETRSDTVLVNSTIYNDAGEVFETTDSAGMITRMTNDAAGREIQRIMNYQASSSSSGGGGSGCEDSADTNITVEMTYTADGNLSTLTALNAYTGDQTTQYIYGTTLADSGIATSTLKRKEIYPDSVDSDDVILFGYNRQSQIVKITDQAGTVHEFDYDLLGRQTQDRVTTLGSGVDGAVRRIASTYEVRGMKSRLTSYDNPTVGMGGIVNDCQYLYNDFSQLVTEYQSHSGAVNTGTSPKVQYAFADGAENTIRTLTLTYPNGRELHSDYGATDSMDDVASRVASLIDDDGTTHLVDYSYLGAGSFVETDYTEPETKYTLVGTAGGNDPETGDIYRGLDRFGRVKDSYWYDYGSSSDTDRIKYGYDRVGNRTYRENIVATAAGKEFDEIYHYDQIHRLKTMDRGTLNGSQTGLTSTTFGQCWTLDETGNWRGFREDDTGDGTWDLIQARTANPVNEITDITESIGPSWFAPGYNRAGNMITMPQPLALTSSYSATYDAWNRLVKLAAGADTVSEYSYDGAKRLIIQKSYAAGVLSETRHYYLTAGWQTIEERLGTSPDSADPERQFVWGMRYIDDCVLRDRDSDHNGTLDERLYALQDANWNVTGLINTTGTVQERMAYTAYGVPLFLDSTFAPTTDSYDWDNLYCGYRNESETGLFHVRHRVLHPELGNWVQRDPVVLLYGTISYRIVTISNLYSCVLNSPLTYYDPDGREEKPRKGLQDWIDNFIELIKDWPRQKFEDSCKEWMKRNDVLGYDWLKELRACPCSQSDAEKDTGYFSKDPNPSFHKGCDTCFRGGRKNDLNPLTPANPGQQCCYKDGNLITGGTGAGSPDRFGPQGPSSLLYHFEQDVAPAIVCEKAGMIDEYNKRRPPDPGKDSKGKACPPNIVNG